LVVLLVGYPLSIGPAYWIISHDLIENRECASELFTAVYNPIYVLAEKSKVIGDVLRLYMYLFGPPMER
jgi:hypothetical protein